MERILSEIDGFPRAWLYFAAPPGAPLVVVLTGTGGTAAWLDRETGWSKLAAQESFALAIPEATPPDRAAPPAFLTNPPRWNDGSPSFSEKPQPDDTAFLSAVIAGAADRGADPGRVFVTGFSNGAGMAFRFAAERADRVTAIAPVAGYCWVREPKPARPVPTLYTVGTGDLLLPFRGGEVQLPWTNRLVRRPPIADTLERWATALGCSPVPIVQREGTVRVDRYPGPVLFDAVTVEGLGHHWPGGRAQLNPRMAGPPSDAVNATEMIWAFFKRHL